MATNDLPKSPCHVFYRKLNAFLAEVGFGMFLEGLRREHYADRKGRPGIPPGVYFRMLLVGYFEGIGSQREIARRCSDSLSLRKFPGLAPTDESPDHSNLSWIRERLLMEVDGKSIAVDSTTLEANATMKSIVRRDTGEDWRKYLKRLTQDAGLSDNSPL